MPIKTQLEWTRVFLKQKNSTNIEIDQQTVDYFRIVYWFNPTNERSMRLTDAGFDNLLSFNIQHFSHKLDCAILPKTLVQLEKFFTEPYFIHHLNCIKTFDEATSLTLTLYNNNLQSYLDHTQNIS